MVTTVVMWEDEKRVVAVPNLSDKFDNVYCCNFYPRNDRDNVVPMTCRNHADTGRLNGDVVNETSYVVANANTVAVT